jgi:hypothetical protein
MNNIIWGILIGLFIALIFTLGLLWGGVRAVDEFIDNCTHYEDNTTVCLVDRSGD